MAIGKRRSSLALFVVATLIGAVVFNTRLIGIAQVPAPPPGGPFPASRPERDIRTMQWTVGRLQRPAVRQLSVLQSDVSLCDSRHTMWQRGAPAPQDNKQHRVRVLPACHVQSPVQGMPGTDDLRDHSRICRCGRSRELCWGM